MSRGCSSERIYRTDRKKSPTKKCNLVHPKYDFMLANVDRLIVGEKVGLECKTTSEYVKDQWEEDEVPDHYILQCQHYMAVTGYIGWWIAVLIGGNKFRYKYIPVMKILSIT